MWSVRIATSGVVLAVAMVSAAAQPARTSPPGDPLPLLIINQGPIVEPSPIVADKPARQAPAKPRKSVAATRPRPAPARRAAAAHGPAPWPAAYADTPSPMTASPLASLPASASAKPVTKLVAKPGRNKPTGDGVVDWDDVNALDRAADGPKTAMPLAAASAVTQPQRAVAAMVPVPASQPTMPTMVATPEPDPATSGSGSSWISQATGGALGGGAVGAAIVWLLFGSKLKAIKAIK